MSNLQHTYLKQKNFIPGPAVPKVELINRPVQLIHGIPKQDFFAASGLTTKTEKNGVV